MRRSRYLLPTLRESPSSAVATSHKLSLRAGLVRQEAAGIFSWLPLGLRVLRRIERIVREEMDRAGAVELLLPTLQLADLWRKSGRYDDYGAEMLRITDRHGRDLLYGPTAEEVVTEIVRRTVSSYHELPLTLYNIQWKFRDEVRPRFGVLRGREFLMKDAYSFDIDVAGARESYSRMFVAYLNLFARLGIQTLPVRADPGPIGGDLTHEFIVLAPTGESLVYCDRGLLESPAPGPAPVGREAVQAVVDRYTGFYAATDETHDAAEYERRVPEDARVEARGIEVGHIFFFGDKYSKAMGLSLIGPEGEAVSLQSGSYGVGVSRLVAAIIEASHDDRGIIWPEAVAPFDAYIIELGSDDAVTQAGTRLYQSLNAAGVECLLDDRQERAGVKFADGDLIGIPYQVIVGTKGLAAGQVEIKRRRDGVVTQVPLDGVTDFFREARAPNA